MELNLRQFSFLILIGATITACQTPSSSVPPPENAAATLTPEDVAALPPELSKPAVDRLANELIAVDNKECSADPEVGWDACMNVHMLTSFDRYGFLTQHCRRQVDSKAFRDCVFFGRAGVNWLLAIGADPDTDFDWSKPEQSRDLALKKLNGVLTDQCAGQPEEQGNSCMTAESARLLDLSTTVAARCSARKDPGDRGACIIDAHDTAMYQAALTSQRP
ncbi:MAG: hypothetical protein ACREEP_13565 [Dongiaceae bacterium]